MIPAGLTFFYEYDFSVPSYGYKAEKGAQPLTDKFESLFGNNTQAVVVEKDGKIECFNDAAASIIPHIETAQLTELFPSELLSNKSEHFIGKAEIAGGTMIVSVCALDGCRVFNIVPAQPRDTGDWTNIFSAVGYELNNSLAVLKMASGLLLPYIENQGNPRLSQYASMIYHRNYKIQRVANNISDFGDFITSNLTLSRAPYDLVASSRELLDSARHLVADRGVELRFESELDSLVVYADKDRLDKLILNLLSNSLLHTPSGGTVILTVASAGDRFVLTVSDNGQGIPTDVMQTVWAQYRADRGLTDRPVGIGLGLPIVHAIAQQHGGSVMLESRPGDGTAVTVSIPITQPETTVFRDSARRIRNERHAAAPHGAVGHRQLRQILPEVYGLKTVRLPPSLRRTHGKNLGIYIHIPFCVGKCAYCDFYSLSGHEKLMPSYQHALLYHIKEYAPQLDGYLADTVYFGGGTPSYYGSDRLIAVFGALKKHGHVLVDSEVTAEVNPESVTKPDLLKMRHAGFNRLSIGVQCADDALLKSLGRKHTFQDAEHAPYRVLARRASTISASTSFSACLPRRGTAGPTL